MTQTLSDELSGQDKDQASSKGDIRADPTQTNGLEQDEYLKDNKDSKFDDNFNTSNMT